jgi:hypothetical protein
VRGFWAQAPTTFVITGFNVPNEQNATHQSVWFFTYPGTDAPSTYNVTAADTKFIGSGPVGTSLTPRLRSCQQGTWFGCLGTCHDATGTTMHNSYAQLGHDTTTILGSPDGRESPHAHRQSRRHRAPARSPSSTAGPIGRVDRHPRQPADTIPDLAASGDTPYFGANPQLDMTAAIPGAQAGILAGSLQSSRSASRRPSAAC